jgi:hypothetical protein
MDCVCLAFICKQELFLPQHSPRKMAAQQPNTNSGYSSWIKHLSQQAVVEIINNSDMIGCTDIPDT